MGLSLRDLTDRSGVSAPMLSQVERGETSPTLATAGRIAHGLELSLSQLLRLDESDGVTVIRADQRQPGGARNQGHTYEVLTPPLPGQRAEVSQHTLAPHAATGGPGDPPMHEPGSRETALVTQGQVKLVCDGVATTSTPATRSPSTPTSRTTSKTQGPPRPTSSLSSRRDYEGA